MTTCIWDGKSKVYADTLTSYFHKALTKKIHIISDNTVSISSGNAGRCTTLINKLKASFSKYSDVKEALFNLEEMETNDKDFKVILINKLENEDLSLIEYKIYVFHNTFKHYYEIDNKAYGIGSGSDYALGALAAGASPLDAMRIASNLDENTNKIIDVFDTETWTFEKIHLSK